MLYGNLTPGNLTTYNGKVYFQASDATHSPRLWTTDGTVAGTHQVFDPASGTSGPINPTDISVTEGRLVFESDPDPLYPFGSLWASDGTAPGTQKIRDGNFHKIGQLGQSLLLVGNDATVSGGTTTYGPSQIYVSDGTAAGTLPILTSTNNYAQNASHSQKAVGDRLVFDFNDGIHGDELWSTDGTATGTQLIADISSGSQSTGFSPFVSDGAGHLLFTAGPNSSALTQLWTTDGTAAGTRMLNASFPTGSFAFWNGSIYYTTGSSTALYKADSTGSNSVALASMNVSTFLPSTDRLYFIGDDYSGNGRELWTSDGTTDGTVRLSDSYAANASQPQSFTALLSAAGESVAPPSVRLSNDTGPSAGDAYTRDAALTIVPSQDGDTLAYTVDGTPVVAYDPSSLGQGQHTVSVVETDGAGRSSTSATVAFTLDTVAPVNAVDTRSDYPVRAGTPTPIQGHTDAGEAGDRVEVAEGGNVLGSATVDGSGAWRVPVMLAEGPHHLTAAVTDAAGNVGTATVDLTADPGDQSTPDTQPPILALSSVSGQPNHETGNVLSGTIGTADAGAVITIRDASIVLGTTIADSRGVFNFGFSDTKDGPTHSDSFTATATDAAGNTGSSDTLVFDFDYTPNQTQFGTLTHDPDSHVGQVYALYDGLLDRAPEQAGAQDWVFRLDHGASLAQVTQGFLDSLEERDHITVAGNSNAAYVEQLYEAVLGRHGDTAEAQGWVDVLDRGASRVDVADAFVFSQENENQLQGAYTTGVYLADPGDAAVARLYYGLLDRAPEAGGLKGWEDVVHDGASLTSIAQGFLTAPEYSQRYPTAPTDQQFVDSLYQDALGRAAEPTGRQGWLGALADGASRASVAVGIAESQEAQAHLAGHIERGWHLA